MMTCKGTHNQRCFTLQQKQPALQGRPSWRPEPATAAEISSLWLASQTCILHCISMPMLQCQALPEIRCRALQLRGGRGGGAGRRAEALRRGRQRGCSPSGAQPGPPVPALKHIAQPKPRLTLEQNTHRQSIGKCQEKLLPIFLTILCHAAVAPLMLGLGGADGVDVRVAVLLPRPQRHHRQVIRRREEPLDRVHHTGVVHRTVEPYLHKDCLSRASLSSYYYFENHSNRQNAKLCLYKMYLRSVW